MPSNSQSPSSRLSAISNHLDPDDVPMVPFSALPLDKTGPRGNAWGRFPKPKDELGTLNFLTPANTALVARENILEGVRVCTDWPLDRLKVPCFGRQSTQHTILPGKIGVTNDDKLEFNTQASSQWDGFRHFGWFKDGRFLGGRTRDEVMDSRALSIDTWVKNGGIVGRGVLLDYVSWAEARGIPITPFKTTSIPAATLKEISDHQGVTFRRGDILLLRTGWVRGYNAMTEQERVGLASVDHPPSIGVESSEDTLKWIWESEFAAVAGDQPSWEAWPPQNMEHFCHEWLLAGWGTPIGELFDLERLSEECRQRNRWTFFFSSVPLNVPGLVASPPNGVAIF